MLMTPFRCWRNRTDCSPLHSIEATPPDLTPEEFEAPDFNPISFVCCGLVAEGERKVAQDCYRLCFKNDVVDDMSDNDLQDLTHVVAVIGQALAITATRMVNSGTVEVPTMQGRPHAEQNSATGSTDNGRTRSSTEPQILPSETQHDLS
mgnify:CR=1 FL=1